MFFLLYSTGQDVYCKSNIMWKVNTYGFIRYFFLCYKAHVQRTAMVQFLLINIYYTHNAIKVI